LDAFFLHIQGSGRLRFADGSVSHALYAGNNNQPYVSLGKVLRDRGLIAPDKVNMQSIREYLLANPGRSAELYDANPRYVFFREAELGPVGAMGRPLTPYVSIATDRALLPHGSLVFAVFPLPDAVGRPERAFYGLTLPQDTGGAIRGNRIDLFCGAESEAAHVAGYLDWKGAVYLGLKKQVDQMPAAACSLCSMP
jgi:membrane-bound lytic murein transglycosylase A